MVLMHDTKLSHIIHGTAWYYIFIDIALTHLSASPDALGRGVVSRLAQILWQQTWFSVFHALPAPGGTRSWNDCGQTI